jgi:hypothetical protein
MNCSLPTGVLCVNCGCAMSSDVEHQECRYCRRQAGSISNSFEEDSPNELPDCYIIPPPVNFHRQVRPRHRNVSRVIEIGESNNAGEQVTNHQNVGETSHAAALRSHHNNIADRSNAIADRSDEAARRQRVLVSIGFDIDIDIWTSRQERQEPATLEIGEGSQGRQEIREREEREETEVLPITQEREELEGKEACEDVQIMQERQNQDIYSLWYIDGQVERQRRRQDSKGGDDCVQCREQEIFRT